MTPVPAPTLREATDQDLAALAAMERELFGGEAWSEDLLAAELRAARGPGADRCYLVAQMAGVPQMPVAAPALGEGDGGDGAVVGYAGLWVGDGRGDADLLTIATAPGARRRGVARALAGELLAIARRAGCSAVLLEVRVSNAPAQRLYESLGFEVIGRRSGYYHAPREDALVMRRALGGRPRVGPVGAEVAG